MPCSVEWQNLYIFPFDFSYHSSYSISHLYYHQMMCLCIYPYSRRDLCGTQITHMPGHHPVSRPTTSPGIPTLFHREVSSRALLPTHFPDASAVFPLPPKPSPPPLDSCSLCLELSAPCLPRLPPVTFISA